MTARGTAAKAKRVRTTKSPSRTAAKPRTLGAHLAEAREQQAATAEILRVISRSPTDVQPVFETIAAHALRLCDASFSTCCRFDGELIHLAALHHLKPEGVAAFHAVYPCAPNRGGNTQRAILTGTVVHIPDVLRDPEYAYHDAAKSAAYRSALSVPLLRDGHPIGAISVFKDAPKPFSDTQIGLLKTFADQAVIAIENVRLFNETKEALDQQTATAQILQAISSSPGDLEPVLETVVRAAAQFCNAPDVLIMRLDHGVLRGAAAIGPFADVLARGAGSIQELEIPLGMGTVAGRSALQCRSVHVHDLAAEREDEYPEGRELQRRFGHRTIVSTPLLREGVPLGAIVLFRTEVKPFSDKQLQLVQTFADQAVIAIENVRLFKELGERNHDLTEALEQQTATSDILRVISQSQTDAQPVFETIAAAALNLCRASSGHVVTFDGELIHLAALANLNPGAADALRRIFPRPPSRDIGSTRAVLTGRIAEIPDVLEDREYAVPGAAVSAGYRSVLAVPLIREGTPIGAIGVARPDPGPFPETQIELLKTFADQAVIAIENVRLFKELEARNRDLTEALEQQTATSEILRVISRSQTDVQPVFDTIVNASMRLCRASAANFYTFDGELIHLVALENVNPEYYAAIHGVFPRPPGPDTAVGRAIQGRNVVMISDVLEDRDYAIAPQTLAGGFRSVLAVPLLRENSPIGAIIVGAPEPGVFPDSQIALLQTFADQAVIAIENVRLFKELEARNRDLTEALEQQTATSDILRVISQSQTDVQPVFDTIVHRVMSLCDAAFSGVYLLDGETLSLAATAGLSAEERAVFRKGFPRKIGPDTVTGRAALEHRVVQTHDLINDPEFAHAPGSWVGARTVLGVPLMRDGKVIGAIGVWRAEIKAFSDTQIALLQTFADQAVIAIENVRLFNELETRNHDLTEALEQQTATSDILRVISQSQTDVQPVFDTIAKSVVALCRAQFANVFTYDGKLIHLAAFVNVHPEYIDMLRSFYPRPPGRATAVTRAIESGSVCTIADVLADPEYQIATASATGGFRSILAVPLMRDGKAVGGIAVGRPEPGDFPESQVMLLQTFADQAVIAIENVRLFTELEARTTELTQSVGELKALGEVGQAVSSTLDLETVLSTIVSRAAQLAGMDGGSIWEYDEAREEFYLRATDRLPEELVEVLRATPIRKGEGALGRLALTGEPVAIRDIADERLYQSRVREVIIRSGYRSVLAVPLLYEECLLGALAVNRSSPGDFALEVIALLKTFATQSALAIQNARLFREIEDKSRQLEVASQHKSEFLANMSHELRTPLNAIIGFSEVLSEQMFGTINDKQAEYLQDILESGRHLLSLINDILDLSKIEAGRMELEPSDFDLPGAIENALILVRERANRHGITLAHTVDERLGPIRADERKVKQVLLNLLSNALKFTPEGGRIDVRARVQNGAAEISVTDTGIGIAPEDQATVFEEFRQVGTASKKVEGTGLGLAISRKFIELHGGTIGVTSKPGIGSTFAFTLPLPQPSHHNG